MGFYGDKVLPRIVDKVCGTGEIRALRREVVDGLQGKVVEIGFGSGLNLRYLEADEVEKLLVIEPNETARRLAESRIAESAVPVDFLGLDGQALPLEDSSVDAVLSTFSLCTIPDVKGALREVRRVLRPGGELHFLEHGLSPDPKVARWQHRLTPLERRIAGGCHFDRPIADLVTAAGLEVTALRNTHLKGPKFPGYIYLGIATKPA
jgi:ubiquinone/menaquinone biosynthesis C-methylase UbiE